MTEDGKSEPLLIIKYREAVAQSFLTEEIIMVTLRIGIYLILLEARDDNNNVFERLKDVVVVARKL